MIISVYLLKIYSERKVGDVVKGNTEVAPVNNKTINYSLVKDIEGIILKIQKSDFYGDNELKSLVNTYIQDLESELK